MRLGRYGQRVTYFISGLILTGSLVGVQASDAATYYVATTGNDANQGTASQPLKTIDRGVKMLKPGDTLVIKSGTYAQRISGIPSGTSASNHVIIKAEQRGSVTLRPSGSGRIVHISNTARYITLDGLNLDGSNLPSNEKWGAIKIDGVGPFSGASHITLRNLKITNIARYSCIQAAGSHHTLSNIRIDRCSYAERTTGNHGVYWGSRNGVLERIHVSNVPGYGIHLYYSKGGGIDNNIIRNSIFQDSKGTGRRGIYIGSGTGNKVYNNVVYRNEGGGITVQSKGNSIRNNIIYANGGNPINDAAGGNTISHNLTTDPKFVSATGANFRLQSSSPAINTGVSLGEVRNDYDGVSRPQGNAYDIGAFEYRGSNLQAKAYAIGTPEDTKRPPAPTDLQVEGLQ